jgi:hypothetical protein
MQFAKTLPQSFKSMQQTIRTGLLLSLILIWTDIPTVAVPLIQPQQIPASTLQQCPRELPELIERMLSDLPSYINRTRTRAGITKSYVVLAAKPEFEPLSLFPTPSLSAPQSTQQVFFTTLMRRYDRDRITYLQEYHWVFLTQTPQDWRYVMMYSTLGPYPAAQRPTLPPRNSSDGSVAQAIQDWLADCQAGLLPKPPAPRKPRPPRRKM